MAGRRSEGAVVAVANAVEGVVGGVQRPCGAQQLRSQPESFLFEHGQNVGCRCLMVLEGHVGLYEPPHLGFQLVGYVLGYGLEARQHAVVAVRYGMFYSELGAGQEGAHGAV